MRSISAFLLAVLTALAISGFDDAHARDTNAASIVRYTLAPALSNGHLVGLDVTLRFRGEASGLTILDLPDEWAGQRELWRNVSLLDVRGAISVVNIDASTKLIRARPRESLTVRYRITSGIDHEPDIEDRQPFRPWIRPNWFYVTGEGVFATPHGRDKSPALFDWTDAPPGFGFASSAEIIAGARQSTHLAMTVSDVVDSVSIGGWDLRFLQAPGSVTRLVVRGQYAFDDQALYALAAKIIESERAFWREPASSFLITLAPVQGPAGSRSFGGTGRSHGFLLAIDANTTLADTRSLLAHEFEHNWIPAALGDAPTQTNEVLEYWFSEGFTDFYTRRALVRAGLVTPAEFIGMWNDMLRAYAMSGARDAPNEAIKEGFWKDPDLEKLPYQRGALLAALWDHRLKMGLGRAGGLDDVLLAQRDAVAHAGKGATHRDAVEWFVKTSKSFGLDVHSDIERFVTRGERITLPAAAFGGCITVTDTTLARFDRGFDAQATVAAGNVINGVRPDSAAYTAGLRDGMKLVRRAAGVVGDSRVDYVIDVLDGETSRSIRYAPQGAERFAMQELLPSDATAPCNF